MHVDRCGTSRSRGRCAKVWDRQTRFTSWIAHSARTSIRELSGIGLYLAELAAVTGDTNVRDTAIGALRHALSRHADVEPAVRFGFYVGWSGIAVAAVRVGSLLDDSDLVERGLDLPLHNCR